MTDYGVMPFPFDLVGFRIMDKNSRKPSKHTKRYIGKGVGLYCDENLIVFEPRSANFNLRPCSCCGIYIWTVGGCPQNDKVFESKKFDKGGLLRLFERYCLGEC